MVNICCTPGQDKEGKDHPSLFSSLGADNQHISGSINQICLKELGGIFISSK
jgi:hypothetical protein